jgi:regulatory protein
MGDAERAISAALRLLKARARSRFELDSALERRGFSAELRSSALEKLAGWGYLNDERVAQLRALNLMRAGKGPLAALQKLAALGLSEEAARTALAHAEAELGSTPEQRAHEVLSKRGLSGAKAARLLASRGFPEDIIHSVVGLDSSREDE